MNALHHRLPASILALFAALAISPAGAQVPVDDSGAPLADYESFEPESSVGGPLPPTTPTIADATSATTFQVPDGGGF